MGRGQFCLRPNYFRTDRRGVAHRLGQGTPMLPRLHTFETASPEGAAGFGAHIVDATDKARVICARKLGAMPSAHFHEPAAVVVIGEVFGDGPRPVFGHQGDIAVMGAKTAGAAGRAVDI